MKILNWEDAKKEGAREVIKKIEKMLIKTSAGWEKYEEAKEFNSFMQNLKTKNKKHV